MLAFNTAHTHTHRYVHKSVDRVLKWMFDVKAPILEYRHRAAWNREQCIRWCLWWAHISWAHHLPQTHQLCVKINNSTPNKVLHYYYDYYVVLVYMLFYMDITSRYKYKHRFAYMATSVWEFKVNSYMTDKWCSHLPCV